MKTTVKSIRIESAEGIPIDLRVSTGDGNLMVNRVISLLSSYPSERVEIPPDLELDVMRDYVKQIRTGVAIIFIAQNDNLDEEFLSAIFGYGDECKEPYFSNADSILEESIHSFVGTKLNAESVEVTMRAIDALRASDPHIFIEQTLRAHKRLKRFIARNGEDLKRYLKQSDAEKTRELIAKISERVKHTPYCERIIYTRFGRGDKLKKDTLVL